MAGASMLAIECDPERIEKRLQTRYLEPSAPIPLDEALALIDDAKRTSTPISVAVLGKRRGARPRIAAARACGRTRWTDQTSAHDPVNRLLAAGWTLARWREARERDPQSVAEAAKRSMVDHVAAMVAFHRLGIPRSTTGNNIRQMAADTRARRCVRVSGLRPGVHPAAVLPRHRAVPLGRAVWATPTTSRRRTRKSKSSSPTMRTCTLARHWRASASRSKGCPRGSAGSDWAIATASASRSTRWSRAGELKAPIVIGRDHLDQRQRRVAQPARPKG